MTLLCRTKTAFAGLLTAIALLATPLATPRAAAQTSPTTSRATPSLGVPNPFEALRTQAGGPGLEAGLALEGAVDPAAYRVGPGDVFSVVLGTADVRAVPVSAEGVLLLPEAGAVRVAGLTLAEARQRALTALRGAFRNVPLDVALAQPRQFYVHVSGAVPTPGRYLAQPVARVASVLALAFADTTQAAVANPRYRPSLRNVTLVHRDGQTASLDLLRYFATGSTEHNPYLTDGDVVRVPTFRPDQEAVFIDGAVAFPGAYDYRTGDTVLDLLVLGTGQETPRGFAAVRLTQRGPDGAPRVATLSLEALLADPAGAPRLQPLDHVYVLPALDRQGAATVDGAVRFPGTYPIEPGRTTLQDLLELAGGLRDDALPRAAYLQRDALPRPDPDAPAPRPTGLPAAAAARGRAAADSSEVARRVRLSGFDFLGRTYAAQELRQQNRVVLDLPALLGGQAEPVLLQDGDRLVVPRDEQTVFVFGEVVQPGYVTFRAGQPAAAYVQAAGGRSPTAGVAYVVKAGTGEYVPAGAATVASGDLVFVAPEAPLATTIELERLVQERERDRAQRRSQTVQSIIQALGPIVSLISTYLILNN